MDVIVVTRDQVPGGRLSSFESALTGAGELLPEGDVLIALAETEPAAEGSVLIDGRAPHRAQLFLISLPGTPEELLEALVSSLLQRLFGQGVTLVLATAPEGEGAYARALEACGFEKRGTIPGYERKDDGFLDADLYALDLREKEEDGDEKQRTYVISMLRDGYDDGNIAYFCGVEETYVHAVREELGIPEPE